MKRPSRQPPAHPECPLRELLDGIGNKWSYIVFLALAERPMRYGEFRIDIADISERALAQTLRKLRREGLVTRERLTTPLPGVRYHLTDLGASLVDPIKRLERWAIANMAAILKHRQAFDDAKALAPRPLMPPVRRAPR